jgi:hypothetical protein
LNALSPELTPAEAAILAEHPLAEGWHGGILFFGGVPSRVLVERARARGWIKGGELPLPRHASEQEVAQ